MRPKAAPQNVQRMVITGAGSGIGRALAVRMIQSGAMVVLVGRTEAALQETRRLAGAGDHPPERQPQCIVADVTTSHGRRAIADAVEAIGGLDLLINNAGRLAVGPLSSMTDGDIAGVLDLNVAAPACLIRDLLPWLRRGTNPRVVNIGSMFGDIAFPFFSAYSASKFALRGLSDALRRELSEQGIAVTYVAPRATRTPAVGSFAHLVAPFAMRLDDPDAVADHIARGIAARKRTIYPQGAERFFIFLQSLFPGQIDAALIRQASGVDPLHVSPAPSSTDPTPQQEPQT